MGSQPPSKFSKTRPVFSDASSDTEYTSSGSEEAPAEENKNCAESQAIDGPHDGIPPVDVPLEELAPSTAPQIVSLERSFVDISGSDVESDASSHDVEVLEVRTPNLRLVVDLSDSIVTQPIVKHVEAKKELVMESGILRHCSGLSSQVAGVSLEQQDECVVLAGEDIAGVSMAQPEERVSLNVEIQSEDEARVLMAHQNSSPTVVVPTAPEECEDEASTISGNYKRGSGLVEVFPPDWSRGVLCDMCERGPSLSLGAWYAWCCGKPSRGCDCTYEDQQQKRKMLTGKSVRKPQVNDNLAHVWSGKVHRLCALWSSEVYQNKEEPWIMMELETAMRCSRKFKCSDPDCGRLGATLGCRAKRCRKIYHYPCADRLSALAEVRMWDGYVQPIACKDHRHEEVKQKKRKKGKLAQGAGISRPEEKALGGADANEIGSGDEEGSPRGPTVLDNPVSEPRDRVAPPQSMGANLLTPDFSYGCESVPVLCTNDVDDESPPYMEYLTKTRFQSHPLGSKDCPQPPPERLAKACKGCTQHDLDDPSAPVSVHVPFERREDDDREDWLEERMYGRLPYDKHGRLLIGMKFNELVECNERCECGELCKNREMQKGLRIPLELYKTKNKGWAVRTLVAIARGKFVIQYVAEMMTQDQAQRYGQESHYIETKRSYLQELDYPESKRTPDFLLDGFYASNVARFINHSCDPNLKMYRVYVETTYKWLSHIAFYAMRDIEAGEELAYNYNYKRHDEENEQEKDLTHVKCFCGSKNCHEWLLVHTDVES